MADSSQVQLSYIAESAYGTTPTSPTMQKMRFTGESLKASLQHVSSNEIRGDRNVPDVTQVGGEAAGSVNIEMSYGSFDPLLEALLQGTWTTNVLKNGVTARSFTLEKKFENGSTDQYHRFLGSRVNALNLSLQARSQVTGSFDFMAKQMTKAEAILSGETYTDVNTNPVMNTSDNVANLAITGYTSPEVMALSLAITNNMGQQPVIGNKFSKGIRSGNFVVTGQIEAYFSDADLFDLYMDDVASDLTFDIGGVSDLKYNFELPKIKLIDGEVLSTGINQDVMARMQFQAYYNSGDAASMIITRTPGA